MPKCYFCLKDFEAVEPKENPYISAPVCISKPTPKRGTGKIAVMVLSDEFKHVCANTCKKCTIEAIEQVLLDYKK